MADGALFAQSLLIGLSIVAPVGPIGLLVIQRTLQHGSGIGLATGLGAAMADALYGAIGAFGVAGVISALTSRSGTCDVTRAVHSRRSTFSSPHTPSKSSRRANQRSSSSSCMPPARSAPLFSGAKHSASASPRRTRSRPCARPSTM